MTVKNYPQLIASFPDNNNGQITPEDLRNLVDSVELKYNNWTVVKSGNIAGNKFPDPDPMDGKIYLPDNTTWVINDEVVVVCAAIVYGNNVSIIGMSGDFLRDRLLLDGGVTGGALFQDGGSSGGLFLSGFGVGSNSVSSVVFDCTGTANISIFNCGVLGVDAGNISGFNNMIIDGLTMLGTGTPLQITGNNSVMMCSRLQDQAGFFSPTGDCVQILGTFDQLTFDRCLKQSNVSQSLIDIDGSATVSRGIVSNSTKLASVLGDLITGASTADDEWTFTGNAGLTNSAIGGGVIVSGNVAATVNPSAGVYAPINATGVLSAGSQRFSRPARCQLQYNGDEDFNCVLTLSGCARRASGSGDQSGHVSVFVNGVLYADGGHNATTGITINNSNRQFGITLQLMLNTGDTVEAAIMLISSGVDTIVEDLQMCVR